MFTEISNCPIHTAPPPTPFVHQHTQEQQQEQPQQHSATKQKTLLANVERQASSPNISTDTDEHSGDPTRSALLESICKFNRGSLRKVRSND